MPNDELENRNTRNTELEASILANLEADEGFLAYGDWLRANDDPRGELVAVQARIASGDADDATRARLAELLPEIIETDFGEAAGLVGDDEQAAVRVTYRLGFVDDVRVGYASYDAWDAQEGDTELGAVLAALLTSPGGAFVRSVTIGLPDFDGEPDFSIQVRAMAKAGPYPALRSLHVGDFEFPDDTEISWAIVGNMDEVWAAFPNLARVELQGADIALGEITAPRLRHLELRTGALPKRALTSIAAAALPELEVLRVWTGDESYGADSSAADWGPVLAGQGLPKLTTLGVMNCEYTDEIVAQLPAAKILPQLRVLDLSMGTLTDEGARAMLEHAEAYTHLEHIRLGENMLQDTARALSAWPNVVIGEQREWYRGDDRYVAVGE